MRRSAKLELLYSVLVPSVIAITACSPAFDQARSERLQERAGATVEPVDPELGENPGTLAPAQPPPHPSEDVDATAADEAIPSGTNLGFETGRFDLDGEGGRSAALVVPVGWTRDDGFLGLTFEPPPDSDLSVHTGMTVDVGCDGMCHATDWEQRLTGPGGYITMRTDGVDVVEQRDTPGSDGVVLITEGTFGTSVLVLRWDDSADQFFQCEAELGNGDVDLAPAFEAACLAARPDWFAVG